MSQSSTKTSISDLPFDPVEAARAIIPILKETAPRSETQRKVDSAAIRALQQSGLTDARTRKCRRL